MFLKRKQGHKNNNNLIVTQSNNMTGHTEYHRLFKVQTGIIQYNIHDISRQNNSCKIKINKTII